MKKLLIFVFIALEILTISLAFKADVLGKDDNITLPYEINRQARCVWVSPLVNDISRYRNKSTYQREVNSILDNMEKLNLNVLIFHIRIFNDALYESKYNNWSSYYSTNPDWDALPWIIEECHKRGIEFHAWMNPYRVTSGSSGNLNDVAKRFPKTNAASNPDNLVKGSSNIILNPGIPEVQNFLVNVCMEVVEGYDVDAIHFDDYFYVKNIDDDATYREYGHGESIENFRRESVNTFIRKLSNSIANYNKLNNKSVELGISPTAAWANGDGIVTYDENNKAISNGSKGITQGHYGSYLYCDTLYWVNEELIDYILPQCYIGTSMGNELFYGTVDWWSKVCKYSKTKLYIGIGIYRASSSGDWKDLDELKRQFDYMSKYDNIDGYSYFSYRHLVGSNSYCLKNLENAKEYYQEKALASKINYNVENSASLNYYILNNNNNIKIGCDENPEIKYNVIVKKDNDNYSYLGTFSQDKMYEENISTPSEYYVAPVYRNLELGKFTKLLSTDKYYETKFYDTDGTYLLSQFTKSDADIDLNKHVEKEGYTFKNWIKKDNGYYAVYEKNKYKVTYMVEDEVYKEIFVEYGEDAPYLDFDAKYGKFSGWIGNLNNVTEDRIITSTYKRSRCTLYYYNDKELLLKETYYKGDIITINMEVEAPEGYVFDGFYYQGKPCESFTILENTYLIAHFSKIKYTINYDLDGGTVDNLVNTFTDGASYKLPTPIKKGYKFIGFYEGNNLVETLENRNYDLLAKYVKVYTITYHILDDIIVEEVEKPEEVILRKPSKEGYKFINWLNKNEEIITKLSNQDCELYASFKKIYYVNYNLNGGNVSKLIYEFLEGEQIILPIPTKEGYKFIGWMNDDGNIITSLDYNNYNLEAIFKKVYHISYDLNGGILENEVTEFIEGEKITLPIPTKEGYEFIGYYENGEKVENLESRDYNLKAKWNKRSGCNNSLGVLFTSLLLVSMLIIKKRRY